MLCRVPIYVAATGGIVSCGRCLHCRVNRRNKKVGRCALEGRCNEGDALFVTLTYKDDFLPKVVFDRRTGEVLYAYDRGCLDKVDVQNFFKRLLRRYPPRSIRYFYAGEYGDLGERPHYHMVIWGVSWADRYHFYDCWSDPQTLEGRCDPDRLDISIPRSNHDVANYCAGYIMKARTNINDDKTRAWLDGRPPEFFHSSKGLGLSAVPGFVDALKSCVDVPRSFLLDGKSYPVDRYLTEKILDALPQGPEIRVRRQEAFKAKMQDMYDRSSPSAKMERLLGYQVDERVYARKLEMQFSSEKAVEMDQVENRLNFFERKSKK